MWQILSRLNLFPTTSSKNANPSAWRMICARVLKFSRKPMSSATASGATPSTLRCKRLRSSCQVSPALSPSPLPIRQSLETDVDRRIVQRYLSRKEMLVAWGRKLERSPFLVDQVAESERIDEEHRVKLLEEARRMQRFDARKKVIKKEIILRVLAESNAIETLRSEKR